MNTKAKNVLKEVIQKAIEGGWTGCHIKHSTTSEWLITNTLRLCVYFSTGGNVYYHSNEFIFEHDFAKALWGESNTGAIAEWSPGQIYVKGEVPLWKAHLQQMVIAEDPIAYLAEHV